MKPNNFKYKINRIKLLKFENNIDPSIKKIQKNSVSFKITLSFSIQAQKSIISFKADLSYEHKKTKEVYCQSSILVEFHIPEFEKSSMDPESKNYAIPDDFFLNAVSITVGTARGIFFTKLEKTKLASFYIPIVDPSKFLQELKKMVEHREEKESK